EPAARKDVAELGVEEDAHEPLERGTDRPPCIGIAREEALLERSMPRERVAGRDTERDNVARAIEPIPKAAEAFTVAAAVESRDEVRWRRGHHSEDTLELAAKEIDAAVGEARGKQRDDFPVAGVGVAGGELDGVALDSGGVVEVAIELLERFAQCAGSS